MHFWNLSLAVQLCIVFGGGLALVYVVVLVHEGWQARKLRRIMSLDEKIEKGMVELAKDPVFRERANQWIRESRRRALFPKPELRPDERAMRGIPPIILRKK